MRTYRLPHARALSWIGVSLAVLVAGWAGCSGTTTHVSGGPGGSAMGGAASSGTASVATGTGGSAASGAGGTGMGTGGTGGVSGAGGGCASATTKECDGKCVAIDDPHYGCTPTGCAPCNCQFPNASLSCINGVCGVADCDTGFKNCDGNDCNGCETNVGNDPNNCGACGAACTVPHATASCTNGTCGVGVCDSGWTDCNGDPTDGCEANLQNDPMNCGTCGNACTGQGLCQQGICNDCPLGWGDCIGNGMCTKLDTDQNCGHCGKACNLPNAQSHCGVGVDAPACLFDACNPGFADCDDDQSNGCEVDTQTDPINCGGCGMQCSGGALCVMGACVTGGSDAG